MLGRQPAGVLTILFNIRMVNKHFSVTYCSPGIRQEKQKGKFHLLKTPQICGDADMDAQCENAITGKESAGGAHSQGS